MIYKPERKAQCEYEIWLGAVGYWACSARFTQNGNKCPKGHTSVCDCPAWNLRQRKPKRMVKVKAWAAFNREGEIYSIRFTPLNYDVFKPVTVIYAERHAEEARRRR